MTFLDAADTDYRSGPRILPALGAVLAAAAPVLLLAGIGALEGYMMLTSGWSPGFAVALAAPRFAGS